MTFIASMYTVQYIALFIKVLIEPKRIQPGEELFTVNTLFGLCTVTIMVCLIQRSAALANQVDIEIIKLLTQIRVQLNGPIYQAVLKGELYRLKEND